MLKPRAINEELVKMLEFFYINIKKQSTLCECERAEREREGGREGGEVIQLNITPSQCCPGSQLLRSCGAGALL